MCIWNHFPMCLYHLELTVQEWFICLNTRPPRCHEGQSTGLTGGGICWVSADLPSSTVTFKKEFEGKKKKTLKSITILQEIMFLGCNN